MLWFTIQALIYWKVEAFPGLVDLAVVNQMQIQTVCDFLLLSVFIFHESFKLAFSLNLGGGGIGAPGFLGR